MVSSDSEDDQDLLMAAGQWAQNENEMDDEAETPAAPADTSSNWDYVKNNKRDKKASVRVIAKAESKAPPTAVPKNYSLHLTKVPFDATQTSIRYAFIEKNCTVTSVRLVYDTNQKTRERTFRGVAFVDLADESSFRLGLKLHNTAFLGSKRKVNVRPTRTRNELSEIVKKTEERVAMLIARSKEKKRARDEEGDKDGEGDVDEKKKRRKNNKKKRVKSNKIDKKDDPSISDSTHTNADSVRTTKIIYKDKQPNKKSRTKASKSNTGTEDDKSNGVSNKLTKKQRAQKAAIIRSKKKK